MKRRNKKIVIVAGARPNFPKVAPLIRAFNKLPKERRPEVLLVHTGQHYDYRLSKIFFEELSLPKPDFYLGVGSGSHATQTADTMKAFEKVLLKTNPDLAIVVGDVNSTLACALTAHKMGVKVAHVEAGLRSYDRTMPEEVNRLLTDHVSDYLFVSCPEGIPNLVKEGGDRSRIFYVGNVMIDSLKNEIPKAKDKKILARLGLQGKKGTVPYCLATLHRPPNVDNPEKLEELLITINSIALDLPVIMAVHPRTMANAKKYGLLKYLAAPNMKCLEPLGYLDFLKLEMSAKLVITDSGGVQEETTWLGVPCITVRENTERPVTIKLGTNILAGTESRKILKAWHRFRKQPMRKTGNIPGWDGNASVRIVRILNGE